MDGLEELAAGMYDGETRSGEHCPYCDGGSTKENTLFLSRDKRRVFFKCYRASCGKAGYISLNGASALYKVEELNRRDKVLSVPHYPLDEETASVLKDRYYLNDQELKRSEIGVTSSYCSNGGYRVYMPINRYNYTVRGFVARDITGKEGKKALTFKWDKDEPNLAWARNPLSRELIIVEDLFSAWRASSYMNAVALLGTDLSDAKVEEIFRQGFTNTYLALDKDATRLAIRLALKARSKIKVRVAALEHDIKDMTRGELDEFFAKLKAREES